MNQRNKRAWLGVLACSAVVLGLLVGKAVRGEAQAVATEQAATEQGVESQADLRVDLSALRPLPVFHGGRVMPWDTFSRAVVKEITGSEKPTLVFQDGVDESQYNDATAEEREQLAAAKKMFPDGKPRTFEANELLLSWLVEPTTWEHIPFIHAEHEKLRVDVLDLPVKGKTTGLRLKHVSPRQVIKAQRFQEKLREASVRSRKSGGMGSENEEDELADEQARKGTKREQKQAAQEKQESDAMLKRVDDVWKSFITFYRLKFDPQDERALRRMFEGHVQKLAGVWVAQNASLRACIASWPEAERAAALAHVETLEQSLIAVDRQIQAEAVTIAKSEGDVAKVSLAAEELAKLVRGKFEQAFAAEGGTTDERKKNRESVTRAMTAADELAKYAREAHAALYDEGGMVRVIPALNAAALERERNADDRLPPWLDLKTVLYGSPEVLRGLNPSHVQNVREAFKGLQTAYTQRDKPDRATTVAMTVENLATALRTLGEGLEDHRKQLKGRQIDDALVAYTAYPVATKMAREVQYNRIDPFKWSWVAGLATVAVAALAFGVARRAMFWGALAVGGVALAWTAYGFYLRVMITEWAPVTNMYTTVVWVPFVLLSLGMWLALAPVTWPAVRRGWRLNAVPGTWEAAPIRGDDERVLSPSSWSLAGVALLVPRVLLMAGVFYVLALAPYAAGERAIINLLPNYHAAYHTGKVSSTPWLTWVVGWCVLAPSVWFLPRAVLAFVAAPAMLLRGWSVDGKQQLPKVYGRRMFLLASSLGATFGWLVAWYGADHGTVLNEGFSPLMPVLRDNYWLTIHVLTIVSSYAAGMLAWVLGNIALGYYLCGTYREPGRSAAAARLAADDEAMPDEGEQVLALAGGRLPPAACATLAGYVYKAVQVAVVLLAAGTILGGLWADVSWGRFWGWDAKEVWALISLLVYLAILHGRYAGWFGNFGMVAGSTLGAVAIVWAWYGVNFLIPSALHGYGGGEGTSGQWYVLGAMGVNVLYLIVAGMRYLSETTPRGAGAQQAVLVEPLRK